MKAKKLLMLAALAAPLAVPALAQANEQGHVDAYYIPSSNLDIDGVGDDDGDGFGVKGMVPLGSNFFLNGEYQSVTLDDSDWDVDQLRLGGGWQTPLATGTFAVYGEYANIDLDGSEADGLGVHGRLVFPIAPSVNIYGQVGYLWLEDDDNYDIDGLEFLIGASVDFTPNIGAFLDFRQSNLSADTGFGDQDFTFQDVRVGVRVLF
jgi:opacity protein-like surface antigen